MSMTEWITQTFPTNGQGEIILKTMADGGYLSITPVRLASLLAQVAVPPTHTALSALPIATKGGWQTYFDDWKAKGYIT